MRLLLILALAAFATGCATAGKSAPSAEYVLVYLTTGPNSASHTKEDRQRIFQGHMANMKVLADRGDLILAGPFGKPRDKSWRGIFVMDTPDLAKARDLVATDPGVASGEFAPVLVPMRASADLRASLDVDRAFTRDLPKPQPGEPPKNIRGYAMVTADDADACLAAIDGTDALRGRIVWWARLADNRGGWSRGVFVLDATDPAPIADALKDTPGAGVDGWWSTASLPLLPEPVRAWR